MTADLVSRLRDVVPEQGTSVGEMWNLIEEAADEIERLREFEWMYKELSK